MNLRESRADIYFRECLNEVQFNGKWDENPRPKWSDGSPAYSKFITQKSFNYRIDKGDLPLISLRPTAIKGGWYDMEAIYQKQTNIIEEMNPAIHSWWKDFIVEEIPTGLGFVGSIGQTYGHTVRRYDLVNKLLKGMQENPYGRRHIMNLWQEQQMQEDPKALVPCAYETLYSLEWCLVTGTWLVDMTLNQRSQDFLMTASINPIQYVMLGKAICGHLSYKSGLKYNLRNFKYNVQNLHIYDRHMFAIKELLERPKQLSRPSIVLDVDRPFYLYTINDFKIDIPYSIQGLSKPLELAV
jgi:thymidylate synthase